MSIFQKAGGRISGFFMEEDIMGMLEAAEYDSIDIVSPFIGAAIDALCGEEGDTLITVSFSRFLELTKLMYRRGMERTWNQGQFIDFSENIMQIKEAVRATLSTH